MGFSKTGFVSFADIMGWKGIWLREDPRSVLEKMESIKKVVSEKIEEYKSELKAQKLTLHMDIHLISDTFVITSSIDEPARGVDITVDPVTEEFNKHGGIVQLLISECLEKSLLIRGATTYGQYQFQGSTFIGEAIDEAASWHELANEVAVFVTPSAYMIVKDKTVATTVWGRRKPQMKTSLKDTISIEWNNDDNKRRFENIMRDNSPITPDISSKYMNTLDYLETTS